MLNVSAVDLTAQPESVFLFILSDDVVIVKEWFYLQLGNECMSKSHPRAVVWQQKQKNVKMRTAKCWIQLHWNSSCDHRAGENSRSSSSLTFLPLLLTTSKKKQFYFVCEGRNKWNAPLKMYFKSITNKYRRLGDQLQMNFRLQRCKLHVALMEYKEHEFITLNYYHRTFSVCPLSACAACYDPFLLADFPCRFLYKMF